MWWVLIFVPDTCRGQIVHIVLFQYAPSVTASTKNNVSSAFIALKDSCRLLDGSRYIVSIDGGLNNSPEGAGKGMEVSLFSVLLLPLAGVAITRHAHSLRICAPVSVSIVLTYARSMPLSSPSAPPPSATTTLTVIPHTKSSRHLSQKRSPTSLCSTLRAENSRATHFAAGDAPATS